MGNTWGRLSRVTTRGESHGAAIGAVVDGCPPRLPQEADGPLGGVVTCAVPGRVDLSAEDAESYKLYAHQNEDIVRLTPEELKAKMAAKEAR